MTTNFEIAATNVYQPWNNTSTTTGRNRVAISTETNHPTTLGPDTSALSATSLSNSGSNEGDTRAAHVAAIGRSIAAGTYFVSSYQVASSIIDSLF